MKFPRARLAVLLIPLQVAIVAPSIPGGGGSLAAQEPPPGEPVELPELRTADSLTFLEPDGSYTARIFPGAINYQDGAGAWQTIDNTLVSSSEPGYAYENAGNSFQVLLPSDLGATPVKVAKGNDWVTFGLVAASGTPVLSPGTSSVARYSSALPGVDVAYEAQHDIVKETLTLSGPGTPTVFNFMGQASPGLTAQQYGDKIEFVDVHAGTDPIFSFAPPFAVDAAGVVTEAEDVSFALNTENPAIIQDQPPRPTNFVVTLTVSPAWLADPARQWPVVVDPTVAMDQVNDCYIASETPSSNFCSRTDLQMGYTGSAKRRILLKFDLSELPPIPTVLKADLGLWVTSGNGSVPYRVHRVKEDWTNSATWNTKNGSTSWSTTGGFFDSTVAAERTIPNLNEHRRWFPTGLVRDWVNGLYPNYGFLLKQATESTSNVAKFVSKETTGVCSNPEDFENCKWPFLAVNYVRRLGELASYKFWDFDLTDRMQARVNVANGNLLIKASDFTVPGTGLNLVADRYYNGYEDRNVTKADSGWRFTVPPNIRLTKFTSDGSVRYEGISGYKIPFIKRPDGSFESPPGIDAKMTQSGSTYALKFNKSEETYNFDSEGLWTSHVDRNGNRITFSYPSSTEIRITDTQGRVTVVTLNSGGLITGITDSGGRTYAYTYDAGNNLTSYRDAAGGVTSFTYDSNKRLTQITTVRGSRTKFTYPTSADKKVLSVIQVLSGETGPTTTFNYDSPTQTVVTNPRGKQTTFQYDKEARVTKVIDARGNSRSSDYNVNGNVLTATDALQQGTVFSYNPQNDLTQVKIPTQAASSWTYANPAHQSSPTQSKDPQGNLLDYTYDTPGNLTSVRNPVTGDTFTYAYNPNGTLSRITDAKGNITNFFYDAAGNLTSIDYPGPLGTVSFAYTTSISRLASMTDGKSQTSSYTYDALDRLTRITFQDGSQVNYSYDGNGNLTSRTDATGTTTFTYDLLNRMTTKNLPGSSISFAWDAVGNLASLTDAGGTVSYGYDDTNNVASLTEPGGHLSTFTYDNNDNRISTAYPNGVKMGMARDNSGRVCKIASTRGTLPSPFTCTSSAPSPLTSFSYTYIQGTTDRALRQTMTDNVAGDTTSYVYDTWSRLTRADRSATGAVDFQYAYDPVGNMTSKTLSGTTTTFTYNAANQLTSSGSTTFTYDGNGNLTGSSAGLSLSYNAKNQTTSITPAGGSSVGLSYADATQDERTAKGSTAFTNHLLGLGRETGTQTVQYRWNDAFTEPFALTSELVGTNRYYYLFDGLGSVVGLTDSAGNLVDNTRYRYEPYGKQLDGPTSVSNPWRFAGAYFDSETGFYKMGTRYYDPTIGRWTQPDPDRGSIRDPISLNVYLYGGCDPVNSLDLTGRLGTCAKILLAFGAVSAVNAAVWFIGTLFGFPILAAIKGFEAVEEAAFLAFGTATVLRCLRRA